MRHDDERLGPASGPGEDLGPPQRTGTVEAGQDQVGGGGEQLHGDRRAGRLPGCRLRSDAGQRAYPDARVDRGRGDRHPHGAAGTRRGGPQPAREPGYRQGARGDDVTDLVGHRRAVEHQEGRDVHRDLAPVDGQVEHVVGARAVHAPTGHDTTLGRRLPGAGDRGRRHGRAPGTLR